MYLAIMLIIVTILIFYNEIKNKMNLEEYILLGITFIAIVKASINYIQINKIQEGFESNSSKNTNRSKNNNNYLEEEEDILIINSEESDEYLDSDELQFITKENQNQNKNKNKNKNSFTNSKSKLTLEDIKNNKDTKAIKYIDEILNADTVVSQFADIPIPKPTDYDYEYDNDNNNDIKSTFNPKVIIGKGKRNNDYNNTNDYDNSNGNNSKGFGRMGGSSRWNSVFKNDGFKFNNTMYPSTNLWRDNHGYYNGGNTNNNCDKNDKNVTSSIGINNNDWTQSMDDYNKGKWRNNLYTKPSDYVDYIDPTIPTTANITKPTNTNYARFTDVGPTTPTNTGSTTPTNTGSTTPTNTGSTTNTKKCGEYDTTYEDQAGNLNIKEYTESKKWVAGYTYVPPIHWDVPQKHAGVCRSEGPNVQKLTGLMDRGLPINALELTQDGKIADTEDTVNMTNLGSMVQKFNYQEQPFSKPYV